MLNGASLNGTLAENVLTLLCYDNDHGRIILGLVEPELFEGDYRLLAERVIEYWRQHRQAPKKHTPDLLADIMEDPGNRSAGTYRYILGAMINLSAQINTVYVMNKLRAFVRVQQLKLTVMQTADLLQSKQEMAIEEVEAIWARALAHRAVGYDTALRLTDVDRVLAYLDRKADEFTLGITQLDQRYVVPARGQAMLFLAPPGKGKSWFLVHTGHQALVRGFKVLHVSLEMSAEEATMRYYQNLFGASKREDEVSISQLQMNSLGRLTKISTTILKPEFTFRSSLIRDELVNRLNWLGSGDDVAVARFPTRGLSVEQLEAYIENLATVEGFIPDMLIVDYLGIMRTDPRDHRLSMGRNWEDLRGLAVRHNLALVSAHQVNRQGARSNLVAAHHVAEDWSLMATSDMVLTYSASEAERRRGLARIFVAKARSEEDRFGVLLTQNYTTGQFCIDSMLLDQSYARFMEEFNNEHDPMDDDDAAEDNH